MTIIKIWLSLLFLFSFIVCAQYPELVNVGFDDVVFPTISSDGNLLAFVYPRFDEKLKYESDEVWIMNLKSKSNKMIYSESNFKNFEGYGFLITSLKWITSRKLQIEVSDGDVEWVSIVIDLNSMKIKEGEWQEGGASEIEYIEQQRYASNILKSILKTDSTFLIKYFITLKTLENYAITIDTSGNDILLQCLCSHENNKSVFIVYNKENKTYRASIVPYSLIYTIHKIVKSNNGYKIIFSFDEALVSCEINLMTGYFKTIWAIIYRRNDTSIENIMDDYFLYNNVQKNEAKVFKVTFNNYESLLELREKIEYASVNSNNIYLSIKDDNKRKVFKYNIEK